LFFFSFFLSLSAVKPPSHPASLFDNHDHYYSPSYYTTPQTIGISPFSHCSPAFFRCSSSPRPFRSFSPSVKRLNNNENDHSLRNSVKNENIKNIQMVQQKISSKYTDSPKKKKKKKKRKL
jgi:hypothetical protein